MQGDMKQRCEGARIYLELDMRNRSFAVEAVPKGKSLTGSLTHAATSKHSRVELPASVRLVTGLLQGEPPASLPFVPPPCSLPSSPLPHPSHSRTLHSPSL